MTTSREQLIAQGLIKPAQPETQPKDRISVLEEGEVTNFDVRVAKRLLSVYQRAKERDLECNLSFTDVKALLLRKTCYYSGVTLVEDDNNPHQRTFERVDDRKGYVKGNVVACSLKYNQIKQMLLENTSSKTKPL